MSQLAIIEAFAEVEDRRRNWNGALRLTPNAPYEPLIIHADHLVIYFQAFSECCS